MQVDIAAGEALQRVLRSLLDHGMTKTLLLSYVRGGVDKPDPTVIAARCLKIACSGALCTTYRYTLPATRYARPEVKGVRRVLHHDPASAGDCPRRGVVRWDALERGRCSSATHRALGAGALRCQDAVAGPRPVAPQSLSSRSSATSSDGSECSSWVMMGNSRDARH